MDILIKQLLSFNDIEDKLSYLCNVSALLKDSTAIARNKKIGGHNV